MKCKHKFEFERHNNIVIKSCVKKKCVHVEQAIITKEIELEELCAWAKTNFNHPKLNWKKI